ncbi:MAG: hypothetical protein GY856_39850, partial [bacterium]|nr:hypothetical protein [bacterium]
EWERGADAVFVDEGPNGMRAGRWLNLWLFDVVRKTETRLTGEELLIDEIELSPDGRRTNTNLYRLDLATGEVTAMTRAEGTLKPLAFSRHRARMVYSFDDFVTPPDLYVSDLRASNPVRLTRSNPWIGDEILLGKGGTIRWSSKDGMEIEGVLVVPATPPPGEPAARARRSR